MKPKSGKTPGQLNIADQPRYRYPRVLAQRERLTVCLVCLSREPATWAGGRPTDQFRTNTIPTGLLESELFGHEKGAFTGAIMQRLGRFELANRGTAFLDEIGEISLELQPKLLRVLQEREFERLGSTRTIKTDARLIAATNRDLAACVEERTFRADLFYRLNVFPIQVPSLVSGLKTYRCW